MKAIILSLGLLTSLSAYLQDIGDYEEDDLNLTRPVIYVGLGSHCQSAGQLREHHLVSRAFPFDWLISSCNDDFIKILYDDFAFFLDKIYLFSNPVNPWIFENAQYKIEFRYEWLFPGDTNVTEDKFDQTIEVLKKKADRRINRFRKLRLYSGKVFFIRTASPNNGEYFWKAYDDLIITPQQALELREALRFYFPNLNFTLVIVNYSDRRPPDISELDGIVGFNVDSIDINDTKIFDPIFKTLKLME